MKLLSYAFTSINVSFQSRRDVIRWTCSRPEVFRKALVHSSTFPPTARGGVGTNPKDNMHSLHAFTYILHVPLMLAFTYHRHKETAAKLIALQSQDLLNIYHIKIFH